jgi:hypothetical protein
MMRLYYDRRGEPIDADEWARLFEDCDYQRLATTRLGVDILVSTVWLGIDHSFGGDEDPIIFETMVFGGPDGETIVRYSTEAAALEGHEVAVMLLRNEIGAE